MLARSNGGRSRGTAIVILALLLGSAFLVAIAPHYMKEGYSWRANAISESAAQGLTHAWIARAGLLSFGFAVVGLASSSRGVWSRSAVFLHTVFGICMTAAAAFSHRPWISGVDYDAVEDLLHSIAATGMGFAFALGVLVRLAGRPPGSRARKSFDVVAIAAATLLPLAMVEQDVAAGILQRFMFAIAYVWYAIEAASLLSRLDTRVVV